MQFNCKCVNSICGWQDMCQLQKGKLLKCEQQMCSCKSVELLMFQWHMNKTANVVTAKDFNCLCIQLQMCYQQMYDLQMKNCICSNGQCRFTQSFVNRTKVESVIVLSLCQTYMSVNHFCHNFSDLRLPTEERQRGVITIQVSL